MQIGQFTDTFFPIVDGVGRVVYNYANTIAVKGHECYVIAPMANTGYQGNFPFELIEFISRALPITPQYNTGIPQLDSHYDSRISRVNLDIIHAHSPFIAGREAARIAKKRDIPLIGTFHSKYYDDFYKLTRANMLADIGVRYVVSFYERCDQVWTVSYSSADVLHDYGYRGHIEVVPNGTPDTTPDPVDQENAIARFSLPTDKPILFYCGQMNFKKNIARILEACALLKKDGCAFQMVFSGQGPDVKAITEMADRLDLSDRVLLTGHITEDSLLYGLYQAASLFVFPSLYDTSGMVVREAAAMETPSVVVRDSAAAEPITDGVNGLLCTDSTEDLFRVLKDALSDPQRLCQMGKEARRTIYLSWNNIIDDVLLRYEDAIREKRFIRFKSR